jgi:glycosyltransferase involved in cell wall biosynthesis
MNVDVSIIVPVYFNEGSLKKLTQALINRVLLENPEKKFEIIFIDDGSQDNSFSELLSIRENYKDIIKVIKLTRNFGQLNAILAGYSQCKGKAIINISADMQDPPELINDMIKYHFEHGFEIVICTRENRDEGWFRRLTSSFFYWLMKKLTFKNMPIGGFDFFLISSIVKNHILKNYEANAFLQGQILFEGYKPKFISYHRLKREVGKSRWTFGKKMKMLIDGVLAYSYLPIRIMTLLGAFIALAGFAYAIFIIIAYFLKGTPFKGWAPIMILILVLSGIQMLMLGIIGEYLWRTLDQVRNRPQFIIEKIIE